MKLNIIGGLLVLLLLSGCSAQWHLQRAVKKDPTILKADTVEIVIPEIIVDTVFENKLDTVDLTQDIDSIIASLDLLEICKEVVDPVVEYITKIEFLDTSITKIEEFVTDSFQVIVEVKLEPLGNNSYNLSTTLKDIKATHSFELVTIVEDPSWFNRWQEILWIIAFIVLLAAYLRTVFK